MEEGLDSAQYQTFQSVWFLDPTGLDKAEWREGVVQALLQDG